MNLAELTWPEIAALAPHTPVVVRVAAMEQHGRHLPLATDSMLLGEVVRRVEPRLHSQVLFCPLQWLAIRTATSNTQARSRPARGPTSTW